MRIFKALALLAFLCTPAIAEEKATNFGFFIVPNEYDVRFFGRALKAQKSGPGVLISVGTFRSLSDAAFGNFSRAYLFDLDTATTEFNRKNLELIQRASDRYEYLALLFGRSVPAAVFEDVRRRKSGDGEFLWNLFRGPRSKAPGLIREQPTMAEFLFRLVRERYWWKSMIFGSDFVFNKVKRMASEGRILPLQGNLAGARVLRALAKELRASGERVSAVDISNAFDYIQKERESAPLFFRNLRALPLRADALILFTATDWGGWEYFAAPARDFLGIETAGKDLSENFQRFLWNMRGQAPRQESERNRRMYLPPTSGCVRWLE